MTHSQKFLALSASAFLTVALSSGAYAQTATPKVIGTIDRDKVVSSYPKAQLAADELKKGEEKVQKLVENANKQYEEAKKASKPPAELEGLQKRLQTEIDAEVKKLQSVAQHLEGQLEGEIETAIKAEASSHKVDVVLMKQAVLLGGVDITEGVVKRLAAAAHAGGAKTTTK
ncbi:MAG: OmpH family outer membrane protein [Candidatus Obscuribacterales bacterium]|nr:OmpH family outer membrane protein [Candidatus Obscuribacterales bacterium]